MYKIPKKKQKKKTVSLVDISWQLQEFQLVKNHTDFQWLSFTAAQWHINIIAIFSQKHDPQKKFIRV